MVNLFMSARQKFHILFSSTSSLPLYLQFSLHSTPSPYLDTSTRFTFFSRSFTLLLCWNCWITKYWVISLTQSIQILSSWDVSYCAVKLTEYPIILIVREYTNNHVYGCTGYIPLECNAELEKKRRRENWIKSLVWRRVGARRAKITMIVFKLSITRCAQAEIDGFSLITHSQ